MTKHFSKGNNYRTRNGSLVRCQGISEYNMVFRVLRGGESLGGFPEESSWAGRHLGDAYNTHPDGVYKGEVRAMDVIALEDRFSLNKQYLTNNDSLVEYMGDLKFKLIKAGEASRKKPWSILPEEAVYLTDEDGGYLGNLRGLDIKVKVEKPENDTSV